MPWHRPDEEIQSSFFSDVSFRAALIASSEGALMPELIQSSRSCSKEIWKYRSASRGEARGLSLMARKKGIRGYVFILSGSVSMFFILVSPSFILAAAPSPLYLRFGTPSVVTFSTYFRRASSICFCFWSRIFFLSSCYFWNAFSLWDWSESDFGPGIEDDEAFDFVPLSLDLKASLSK